MIEFTLNKYRTIREFVSYLYHYRDRLDNISSVNVIILRDYHSPKDDDGKYVFNNHIGIGFGEYNYSLNSETNFIIKYSEEGPPLATACDNITKYQIIKVYANSIDDWINLNKDVSLFASQLGKRVSNKLNIYTMDKYGEWIVYSKIPSRKLSTIYIEDSIKTNVTNDIKNFIKDESEYDKFGIPYKKTYMITGVPGSGKTSFIKALCNEFDYNLCILSINKDYDNSTITNAFRNMEKKSFLLIEDIDCIFEKREHKDNPLITFSSFINLLDGVLYKHGLITFITTNHPEKLDHALLRSGRMDMILKINYPKKIDIERLYNDLIGNLDGYEDFYNKIKEKDITMSAIINFLFKFRSNWKDNIKILLDNQSMLLEFTGEKNKGSLYS
jgi:hypothetical protein